MKYVHLTGDEDFGYRLVEEILEYNERKVLYLLSELKDEYFMYGCDVDMVFDKLMVSRKDTRTVFVKGYVVRWKCEKDEKGLDVSEVEPIDSKEQEAISHTLESMCDARLVCFG